MIDDNQQYNMLVSVVEIEMVSIHFILDSSSISPPSIPHLTINHFTPKHKQPCASALPTTTPSAATAVNTTSSNPATSPTPMVRIVAATLASRTRSSSTRRLSASTASAARRTASSKITLATSRVSRNPSRI